MVRRPAPSKPIMPSPPWPSSPGRASAMATSAPAVSARAVSLSARAGTRTAADSSGALRGPAQLAHRQPVAVGGDQGQRVALDLDPHAGQGGQRVVPAGGDGRLADGGRERVAADQSRRRAASPAAPGTRPPAWSAG